jgi:acetylcholinesterase
MVALKQAFATLTVLLATVHITLAAPTTLQKRGLNNSAPLASDIDGAHLLLINDVDSQTSKDAFLLLSKPRSYYDGMNACDSMGTGMESTQVDFTWDA